MDVLFEGRGVCGQKCVCIGGRGLTATHPPADSSMISFEKKNTNTTHQLQNTPAKVEQELAALKARHDANAKAVVAVQQAREGSTVTLN